MRKRDVDPFRCVPPSLWDDDSSSTSCSTAGVEFDSACSSQFQFTGKNNPDHPTDLSTTNRESSTMSDDDSGGTTSSREERQLEFRNAARAGFIHGTDCMYQRNDSCAAGQLCRWLRESSFQFLKITLHSRCLSCGLHCHRRCFRYLTSDDYNKDPEEASGYCLLCLDDIKGLSGATIPVLSDDPLDTDTTNLMTQVSHNDKSIPMFLISPGDYRDVLEQLLLKPEPKTVDPDYKPGEESGGEEEGDEEPPTYSSDDEEPEYIPSSDDDDDDDFYVDEDANDDDSLTAL